MDGLAANHVSMLGYAREVTPAIDRLAYGGLVFPNGHAQAEDPAAAIASLLAGVEEPLGTEQSVRSPSIVEALRENRYATAVFS